MDDKRYGYFRSGEIFSTERRQYVPVGLTAASMRPTPLQKTSPDRNCSVTHLCMSQNLAYNLVKDSRKINSACLKGLLQFAQQ